MVALRAILFNRWRNVISLRAWHVVLRQFRKNNINAYYLAIYIKIYTQ